MEENQEEEDSPNALVSQIAACPAAIDGLSRALTPSILSSLEAIAARISREGSSLEQRGELQGDRQQCRSPGSDNPADHSRGSEISRDPGHVPHEGNAHQSNAVRGFLGNAAHQGQSNAAQDQTRVMQPNIMAMQPHFSWAMQPSKILASQTQQFLGNVATSSTSNAAHQGANSTAYLPQWPYAPWGPYPYPPPPVYRAGAKRSRAQRLLSDSNETDEDEVPLGE